MTATVSLGRSGLKVSRLCLGCLNFGESTNEADSLEILRAAHAAGVLFWDTANVYSQGGSEEILGKAFRTFGFRDDIVLATKYMAPWEQGRTTGDCRAGISGRRSRPACVVSRPTISTSIRCTVSIRPRRWKRRWRRSIPSCGRARFATTEPAPSPVGRWPNRSGRHGHTGGSSPSASRLRIICSTVVSRTTAAGFLARHGWGLIPWSPLAGGQLTGKYGAVSPENVPEGSRIARIPMWRQRTNRSASEVARTFVQLAQEHGLNPAAAATAWTLTNPLVTAPIIGPRTLAQFQELLPAADLALPPSFLTALDELVPPGTAVADFLNNAGWQVGRLPGLDNDQTGAA